MQQLFETEHLNKLKEYIYSDKKIDGIKLIRQVTGLGLKESKDLFESLYHNKSNQMKINQASTEIPRQIERIV